MTDKIIPEAVIVAAKRGFIRTTAQAAAEALTLKAKLGANVTLVPLQGGHIVETYDEVNHDMIVDFIETHAA